MPSLSSSEAHRLGDIIQFAGVIQRSAEVGPANDEMAEYAMRYAMQCVFEACIQIEGVPGSGRFGALFPEEDIRAIRRVANAGRHDYARSQVDELLADARTVVPRLAARAEELLTGHRRLHGVDPTRLR